MIAGGFYETTETRFKDGDNAFVQTAPNAPAWKPRGKKRARAVSQTSRQKVMTAGFQQFLTSHIESQKAEDEARRRERRSVAAEVAEIKDVQMVRQVVGTKRKGMSQVPSVNVAVSGAIDNFGLKAGFAKRCNQKKDVIPSDVIKEIRAIFDVGVAGGAKRSPDQAYNDLLKGRLATNWKCRLLVTPSKIKELFSSMSTIAKKRHKKSDSETAAASSASEPFSEASTSIAELVNVESEVMAARIWRESQQQELISIVNDAVDTSAVLS